MNQQQMRERCLLATEFLKYLANPKRLAILCTLLEGKQNVSNLASLLDMPQATLSNQLSLLREAGFVQVETLHRERVYSLKDERVIQTIELLHRFFCHPSD